MKGGSNTGPPKAELSRGSGGMLLGNFEIEVLGKIISSLLRDDFGLFNTF